ncbi:MAG: cytochrome P450 [Caldilineaceae bacterium]|nr:cytochrome P450 [Caldilineaceae bacterium]
MTLTKPNIKTPPPQSNGDRLPPGPKSNPFLQIFSMVTQGGSSIEEFLEEIPRWFENYGDVVHASVLGRNLVFIRHPEDIYDVVLRKANSLQKGPDYTNERYGLASFLGNGLLTSNGDFWKRQRKLVQPAFHVRRIEGYADIMVQYTAEMLNQWRDGQTIQLDDEMSALTMKIVATSLFSEDVSAEVETVGWAMNVLQSLMTSPAVLFPAWVPTPMEKRRRRAVADLDRIVYGFIADWRRAGVDRGDLLSMLMLATDEEGGGMSDEQVRDELITLLLAGHETTANALNWTFYLLSQHPEVEAKLQAEVDRVLGKRRATLADLEDLFYTRAVVEESIRLYPPAWSFGRQTIEPVEIGGYTIPKGWEINVVSYSAHRDPRWWDSPETFRPERFLVEDPNRPKYAYIPFGGGPRICIGNHFAMMEAQLALATVTQRCQLRLQPGAVVKPSPKITLVPKDGIRMVVERR